MPAMPDATTFCPNCRATFCWTILEADDEPVEIWRWPLGAPLNPPHPAELDFLDELLLTTCEKCGREVEVLELTADLRRALEDRRRGKS